MAGPVKNAAILAGVLIIACIGMMPVSASSPSANPVLEPSPSRSPEDLAISSVRALDPRFADLGTLGLPTSGPGFLQESWITVIPTVALTLQSTPAADWLDPGPGRVVEVMLVDGCDATDGRDDPCATRHWWLYWVTGTGTVVLLAEGSSPDSP